MAASEAATDGWVITYEDTASTLNQCVVHGSVSISDCGDLVVYDIKGVDMLALFADGVWRDARRIRLRLVSGRYVPEEPGEGTDE